MTDTFIKNIQESFAKEAEKQAGGTSETPPAPISTNGKPPEKTPTGGQPGNDEISLARIFKEKHGVDLSDDEIAEFVKERQSRAETPVSVTPAVVPKPEDISEDDMGSFLEQNGSSKDIIKRAKERSSKKDMDIVREYHHGLIKQQFPSADDEYAEKLFKERFMIEPPDGESSDGEYYTEAEKKYSQWLIQQEAERLRGEDKYILDNVRNFLHSNKAKEYGDRQHQAQVDQFLAAAPKKLKISIGKSGAKDLGEFEMPLNDDSIKEAAAIMKDPSLLAKRFTGEKGGLDFQKLYNFLIRDQVSDNLYKSLASHYHSMGLSEIESELYNAPKFGYNAREKEKSKSKELKEAEDYNAKQIAANTGKRVRR